MIVATYNKDPILLLPHDGSTGSFQDIYGVNTNDKSGCKNALTKITLHIGIEFTPLKELQKLLCRSNATVQH
jgi:hypothetical protein